MDRRAKGRVDLGGEQVDMWALPPGSFSAEVMSLGRCSDAFDVMVNTAENDMEGKVGGGVSYSFSFYFYPPRKTLKGFLQRCVIKPLRHARARPRDFVLRRRRI